MARFGRHQLDFWLDPLEAADFLRLTRSRSKQSPGGKEVYHVRRLDNLGIPKYKLPNGTIVYRYTDLLKVVQQAEMKELERTNLNSLRKIRMWEGEKWVPLNLQSTETEADDQDSQSA